MNENPNPPPNITDARVGRAIANQRWLMRSFQSGNFAWKERVFGELSPQPGEHLERAIPVLIAHISDGQKNARERSEVVSSLRSKLEVGNT